MKKKFKKVVFDLDQTLVNTLPLMPYVEAVKANPSGTEGNKQAWNEHDSHIKDCTLYEGMSEVLDYIRDNSIDCAIVSNSVKRRISAISKAFNIPVSSDKMIGRFTVNRWKGILKPDRRIFDKAIELLGVEPCNIISFGNCADDMLVAHKTGVESVACLWGCTDTEKEEMLQAQPYYIIYNPIEIIPLLSK